MKNSLTCFGVGDGHPCADRNHASFLYRFGKTSVLIDCGEPIDRSLQASGLSYDAIDGIFLSHLHADHFGGFFMLMQGFWLEQRRKDLVVHLPGGGIKALKAMLNAAMLFDELTGFRLALLPLKARRPVAIRTVRVTPFPTSHLEDFKARFQKKYRNDFAAYSFLIEAAGRRIGHSADLGRPEDLEPLLGRPLDLLVCELAHFPPEHLFAYLRGRRIKHAVFVHLGREQWQHLGRTRRLAAKMLPEMAHSFAQDGSVIGL